VDGAGGARGGRGRARSGARRRLGRAAPGQAAGGAARLDATSPLALASHLVGLARDADHAGLTGLAEQMLALACAVLDHPPAAFA